MHFTFSRRTVPRPSNRSRNQYKNLRGLIHKSFLLYKCPLDNAKSCCYPVLLFDQCNQRYLCKDSLNSVKRCIRDKYLRTPGPELLLREGYRFVAVDSASCYTMILPPRPLSEGFRGSLDARITLGL